MVAQNQVTKIALRTIVNKDKSLGGKKIHMDFLEIGIIVEGSTTRRITQVVTTSQIVDTPEGVIQIEVEVLRKSITKTGFLVERPILTVHLLPRRNLQMHKHEAHPEPDRVM